MTETGTMQKTTIDDYISGLKEGEFTEDEANQIVARIINYGEFADEEAQGIVRQLIDATPGELKVHETRKKLYSQMSQERKDAEEQLAEVVRANDELVHENLEQRKETEFYKQLSKMDALTGIPNKRGFDESLDAECSAANRKNRPLSMILFDFDNFKSLNSTQGKYAAGDYALCQTATLIRKMLRPEDYFARVGGDEFAILLRETDAQTALIVALKIKRAINQFVYLYEDPENRISEQLNVSVTQAVVEYEHRQHPQKGEDPTAFKNRANLELKDKKEGKNTVYINGSATRMILPPAPDEAH